MSSIVIALPKIEDARKIRSVLECHGLAVASVCSTASNALSSASELGNGVLICGHRLPDMNYLDLAECMPRDFEINTVNMILMQQERKRRKEKKKPKLRSEKEQNYISNAKMMLMQRNHLSEDDAYRYIQKSSMDSGTNMVETAQMLLMLLYES